MRENQRKNWVHEGQVWRNVITGRTLVPIRGGGAPAWDSLAFRVRNDDGTLATATWHTDQDINATVDTGIKFRIRHTLDEYNNKVASITPRIYYNYNSTGWTAMTTTSTDPIHLVPSDNSITDPSTCSTERLTVTPSNGVFEAVGEYDDDNDNGAASLAVKGDYIEVEHCMEWSYANVTDGHTCLIRIYNGTSALDAYTNELTLTVNKVAATNLVVDPLSQTNTVDKVPITKESALVVDPLSQTNAVDKVPVTKESALVVDPLSQSNLVEFVTGMTEQSELTVDNLSQLNTVEHIDLVQTHVLTVDNLSQTNAVDHLGNLIPQFGDLIQSKGGVTAPGGASTLDITLDSSPTEGNLLVGISHTRAENQDTPSGWSIGEYLSDPSAVDCTAIYYKIAGASEPSLVTFDDNTSNQIILAMVLELRGPWATSPLDKSNSVADYPNANVETDQPGTTGTLSQSNEVVVAGYSQRWTSEFDYGTDYAIDSSFTLDFDGSTLKQGYAGGGTSYIGQLSGGHKVVSATTAENPELSWTTLANGTIAVIATFKKAGPTLVVDNLSQSNTIDYVKVFSIPWADGFESGDISRWHGSAGTPTINGTAALEGSYGMEQQYNVTAENVNLAWNNTTHQVYRIKFRVDPNSIVGDTEDWLDLAVLFVDGQWESGIELSKTAVGYDLNLITRGTTSNSESITDEPHIVEAEWTFASGGAGVSKWWIDGVEKTGQTGWTSDIYPNKAVFGNWVDPSPNQFNSGSIYLDSFELYDTVKPVNALTVDNLSQSNTVEKKALTQVHNISVDDLSQSSLVEHISTTVESTLSVENLAQSNQVELVTTTKETDLAVDDLSQLNTVEKITLSTEGAVAGFPLSQSNTVEKVSLTQVHNLTSYDLSITSVVDKVPVSKTSTLTVSNLSVDNAVSIVTLVQIHNLSVDNLAQSNLVLPVVLTQLHILAVDDLSQANTVTKINMTGEEAISPFDLSQSNLVEKVSLTQLHILVVDDLSQSNLVEKPDLDISSTLIVYNLDQTNSVDKVSLTQLHVLVVEDLSQNNIVEEVILSQVHNLTVYDLLQATTIQSIPISGEGTVTPFALSQSSQIEKVALAQQHNVTVSDLSQSNLVEDIVLVPVPKLVMADLTQTNSVDYAGITTTYNILLSDLFQTNIVEHAVWGARLEIANLSQTNTLWNSSFWQEQFEFTVTIAQYMYIEVGIDQQTNIIPVEIEMSAEVSEVDL